MQLHSVRVVLFKVFADVKIQPVSDGSGPFVVVVLLLFIVKQSAILLVRHLEL